MENLLKFKNNNFRIMIVGDPHEKPGSDSKKDAAILEDYLRLQYEAVKRIKPDLVVLMGDNASGKDESEIEMTLLRMTKPYLDNNIPFAFILGNHDLQGNIKDINIMYDIYRKIPGCLLPDEDKVNSFGDYNLTIQSENCSNDAFNLWFIYSGDAAEKQYCSTYDFVKDEQLEWYKNKAEELKSKNGKIVKSVLFQHIPVPEVFNFLDRKTALSFWTDATEGLGYKKNEYYALKKDGTVEGYMGEVPCSPEYNNGEFQVWKDTGDIVAAFFGHDHMNDFIGMTDGIILGQCKTSGFTVYGDGLMQGVRVLDINEKSPENIKTEMVYYRDYFGDKCASIEGSEKKLRDRTSVQLEAGLKVLGTTAALSLPLIIRWLLKRKH